MPRLRALEALGAQDSAGRPVILDLFAGPGGWDQGLRMLGETSYGIEYEKNAVLTRIAAGHPTEQADIALLNPLDYRPRNGARVEGLIASPPCQAFSVAGKRAGVDDRHFCYEAADLLALGEDPRADLAAQCDDPRSLLVTEPIRWARDLRPRWIALEEVRAVKPLWEYYANILRDWGYSVWTGMLNSADYGVPQTRERMILMAHADREIGPPPVTHSRDAGVGNDLFGAALKPWVTMAEALGWGMTERPSTTVMARTHDPETGKSKGGVRPLDGGSGGRATIATARERGDWIERPPWVYERPSTTIVGSFRPDRVAAPGWRKAGDPSRQDTPGSVDIDHVEAGILQSFPADYPWQGAKSRMFEQVGNAIPPRLAAHILARLIDIDPTGPIDEFYKEKV